MDRNDDCGGGRAADLRDGVRLSTPSQSGFTLLELVIAISILLALAGVATMAFGSSTDTARAERSRMDCKTIADALAAYMKDTRLRPTSATGGPGLWILLGDLGTAPDNSFVSAADLQSRGAALATVTRVNTWNLSRWRGPYLPEMPPDPWGRKYIAWVRSFHEAGAKVWIVSAGKNGSIETNWNAAAVQGDDVGIAME